MRPHVRRYLCLTAVAVVVHALALGAARWRTDAIDGFAFRSLDSQEYYAIARNLVDQFFFSQAPSPPYTPDTWRTPGYPAFLALCMAFVGQSAAALIVAQQLLGVATVLLFFVVGRRWLGDTRAFLASLVFLVEPYRVYYSLWLMSTTLQTALILAAWYAWMRCMHAGRLRWFVALGALGGALVLTWPGAVLVPVGLIVGLIVTALRKGGDGSVPVKARRGWVGAAAALVVCCVVVGGWMARNRVVAGSFALSHQSGIVLAYFKGAEVSLWREGRTADRYLETSLGGERRMQPHAVWEEIDRRLRERLPDVPADQRALLEWPYLAQGNRTPLDSFAVSRELAAIAREDLLAAPLQTMACCTVRALSNLVFPLELAIAPPHGVPVSRWRSAAIGAVYLVLAVAVVVRLARRPWTMAAFFPLAVTAALLIAAAPQTDPRFRVPIVPLLLFVAFLPRHSANGKPA